MHFFTTKKHQEPVKIISKNESKDISSNTTSINNNKDKDKNKKQNTLFKSASVSGVNASNSKIAFIEQEKQMLKLTLDHILNENSQLKNQIEDMKQTVQSNKLLLKEYVDNITNKDKVVEKMNNTIDQLQQRLAMYESFQKNKSITTNLNTLNNLNNHSNYIYNNTINSMSSPMNAGNNNGLIYPKIHSNFNNGNLNTINTITDNNNQDQSAFAQASTKIGNASDIMYSQNISNNNNNNNSNNNDYQFNNINNKIDNNLQQKMKKPAYHNKLKSFNLNMSSNLNNNTLQSINDQMSGINKSQNYNNNNINSSNLFNKSNTNTNYPPYNNNNTNINRTKLIQQYDKNKIISNINSLNNSLNISFNSVLNNSQTLVTNTNSINNTNNLTPNNNTNNTNTRNASNLKYNNINNNSNKNILDKNYAVSGNINSINTNNNNNQYMNNSTVMQTTPNINNYNLTINENKEKVKEIHLSQQKILEEILNIKNDIQFLIENSKISKEKIREKLNNSMMFLKQNELSTGDIEKEKSQLYTNTNNNIYLNTHSRNKSNTSNNNNNNNNVNLHTNSITIDDMNQSQQSISSTVTSKIEKSQIYKSIYNLKSRTNPLKSLLKFQDFLDNYNINRNILLLVDASGCCWELIRRSDINANNLQEGENIVSILNKEYENFVFSEKLLNIDIKENYDDSNFIIDI